MKRALLFATAVLLVLGLVGCTDPIANTPLQDQEPPNSPTRVKVFPPYNPADPDAVDGTFLVYREWSVDPYGFGDGLERPEALEYPYVVMYEPGGELVYSGFNVYRAQSDGEGGYEVFELLNPDGYLKPETLRPKPTWENDDPVPKDPPTADFSENELDFPAYQADLDGFKYDQNPLDPEWDPRDASGYFPLNYYAYARRAYGYVDNGFTVGADYTQYAWAVVFVDSAGNMSDAVIATVE